MSSKHYIRYKYIEEEKNFRQMIIDRQRIFVISTWYHRTILDNAFMSIGVTMVEDTPVYVYRDDIIGAKLNFRGLRHVDPSRAIITENVRNVCRFNETINSRQRHRISFYRACISFLQPDFEPRNFRLKISLLSKSKYRCDNSLKKDSRQGRISCIMKLQ